MERALRPRRGRRPGAIIPPAQAPILPVLPALIPPPPRQKDPPLYHGMPSEDVVSWMFRFEQIADYNQWTPEQRLRVVGMSFEGIAQKWYTEYAGKS